ncbi:MAG: DUF4214 domain-containing protein [Pseudomonadota bacterium]
MAVFDYVNQAQNLYIAYFGRPADPAGQYYWAQQIDAAKGDVSGVLAGFAASAESQALYGNLTNTQKVSAIYQNVFGHAPDAAGLTYWTGLLDGGKVSQTQAAWTILQSASGTDVNIVNNKLVAANAFTGNVDTSAEIAGYMGTGPAAIAKAYLQAIDGTPQSLAKLDAGAAVTAAITPPASSSSGPANAGPDTILSTAGADIMTGGGSIDTFVFGAGTRSTLATLDTITDYRAAAAPNSGALDIITITDITTVASNINTVQDLSAQASLAAALNVFANAATTNNGLGVFKWGGDEYIFIETTGSVTTYQAGDTVIKLVGSPFTAGTSIVGLGIDGV